MDCFIGPMQKTYFQQPSLQLKKYHEYHFECFSWCIIQIFVHQSIHCSLMFGGPFQMCPQHPPTIAWSCDTDLIIRIGRKFNKSIEVFHERKIENTLGYSDYSAYLF